MDPCSQHGSVLSWKVPAEIDSRDWQQRLTSLIKKDDGSVFCHPQLCIVFVENYLIFLSASRGWKFTIDSMAPVYQIYLMDTKDLFKELKGNKQQLICSMNKDQCIVIK